MTQPSWRLLLTGTADGATNMAVDQAILEAVAAGRASPTLRFYAWEPACLSLGYTQPLADIDCARLTAQGRDLVRRMTGGRAILHTDELTYSVALPGDHPLVAGGIVESYRRLSQALMNGLETFGASVQADRMTRANPDSKGPVCFEVPSHYEMTANGRKLVGSAQVRKFGGVLQHGSLPLVGDISRICEALIFESDEQRQHTRERVRQRAATLESVLDRAITWEQAAETIADSFRQTFDLVLEPGALTPEEQTRAAELRAEQYATPDWNGRF
ncbi:MAG: lipoate--protein ligase family protein [Chloroflexi bacterium]|nr:lipoate--protein ligase family protein [Chloroflexota bacterium]